MRQSILPLCFCLLGASAAAQPGQRPPQDDDRQGARDTRKVDLRESLRSGRPADVGLNLAVVNQEQSASARRHLSPLERAELRQQLRQEQLQSRRVLP